MQSVKDKINCPFTPFGEEPGAKKAPSGSFYERNLEWSERIKNQNMMKGEKDLEEMQVNFFGENCL